MKFSRIQLVGASDIDFPLEGVGPLTPYVLKAADGLGPPEVDVSIARTLLSGGVYQGRRPQLREVVLRVGLQPEWNIGQTVQELRADLYGLLTPRYGALIKLNIIDSDDQVLAVTEGHLRRLEIAPFSKDPEVQIVLACLEPYLAGPTELVVEPDWTPGTPFASTIIENPGSAPTGFYAAIKFTSTFTGTINLTDAQGYSGELIHVTQDFGANDTLIVDTRPGSRGVWRRRSGFVTKESILSGLGSATTWLQLHKGENTLRINTNNVAWGTEKFRLLPMYWGI